MIWDTKKKDYMCTYQKSTNTAIYVENARGNAVEFWFNFFNSSTPYKAILIGLNKSKLSIC